MIIPTEEIPRQEQLLTQPFLPEVRYENTSNIPPHEAGG